ncbi:ABC transporter ATP-binding protein [Leptospira yasudae]|uniref:ABC transporter ATP-binding protein n=1 Tax=Leptospira yasudae TaxID=2202201 RepID=UPI0010843C56|nr:ABC transporter ATP-binding protein [Leptospira yasudae]TGK24492.1 ABC transporter ATP-binding protein [Leptospira yasudae]TGM05722.1 ABC transporter ATP-binding protein [Leptospira yasudae]
MLNNLLLQLWDHLTPQRKKQFFFLIFLIFLSSVSEIFAIGSILPFISVITKPELLFQQAWLKDHFIRFGYVEPKSIILPFTLVFVCAVILSGATRLYLLWFSTRFSFETGNDLSINIYNRTLYQPYQVHISRNSSEVVSGILIKAKRMIGTVILPVIHVITTLLMAIVIFAFLIQLDPFIVGIGLLGFGGLYSLMAFFARKKLLANGHVEAEEHAQVLRHLQEGIGGVREILLDGNQQFYTELFQESDQKLRIASARTTFTGASPRYMFETLALVVVAFLSYQASLNTGGIESSLPLLGSIVLGVQRLMPVVQQGFQSWTSLRSSIPILRDVLALLDQPLPAYALLPKAAPISFQKNILIQGLNFQYTTSATINLEKVDLEIKKGERVGIIGETGSGKSTLIDVLMGLLVPNQGAIHIDGVKIDSDNLRSWQSCIANVPQSIYISDATIAENIAFGMKVDEIDMEKVKLAAKNAQIADYIESLPKGYLASAGEKGVRLSGGQRQRLGIARALYKEASVIFFDEATSALDSETEKAVIDSIQALSKDLTVIMIAHRLSTIQNCDKVIELKNGKIHRVGSYQEIFV